MGAGQPVDLRAWRSAGLVFLVVFVEAVFGFVAIRTVVIRRHARHVVSLGDVGVQQRLEQVDGAATVRNDVRDLEIDTIAEIAYAEQHAFGPVMQSRAYRQMFRLHQRPAV